MTTVTPSDQAESTPTAIATGDAGAEAGASASIPTQRSGRPLRLLVLGTGDDAAAFRVQAAEAGAELAQRFSVRVTHVVVADGVRDEDARVVRARGAGLPILGLTDGGRLLADAAVEAEDSAVALAGPLEAEARAVVAADEASGETDDDAAAVEVVEIVDAGDGEPARGAVATRAQADVAAAGAAAAAVAAEVDGEGGDQVQEISVVSLVRPREHVDGGVASGPSEVFAGSALEAALSFPPLPADEKADEEDESAEVGGIGLGIFGADADAGVDGDVDGDSDVDGGDGGGARRVALLDVVQTACGCEDVNAEAALAAPAEADVEPLVADSASMDDVAVAAAGDGMVAVAGGAAGGTAASVAWALVPLVSIGLLTPVSIGYAAYRLRSRALAFTTACYAVAVVALFALSAASPLRTGSHAAVGELLTACLVASCFGGTVHSLLIRRRVFGPSGE